jgi:hypothetical protein
MKNLSKKGFMLVETLVVSVFVVGALMFMYIQFQKIRTSYETSFKYNTINSLYAVNNIREYILSNGFENLVTNLGSNGYLDLTSCPSSFLTETNYCMQLLTTLNVLDPEGVGNINKVIFAKEDLIDLRAYLSSTPSSGFSEEMKRFINGLKVDNDNNKYRLLVQFNDNTYASLKIYR